MLVFLQRDSACASAMRYRLIKGPGNAFSPEVAGQLQHFNFTPIETPFGTFTVRFPSFKSCLDEENFATQIPKCDKFYFSKDS